MLSCMAPSEIIGGKTARRRRIERRSGLVGTQEKVVAQESHADAARAEIEREKDEFLKYGGVCGFYL